MIRVGLCDDEAYALERLEHFVQDCFAERQIFACVETFRNGQELFYEIEDGRLFDLLLLDIEMPRMDGMALAAKVRGILPDVLIIFVTSHMEYVLDAYELSIFRYIPKTGEKERLRHALLDAAEMAQVQLRESYVIHGQNRLERIPLKNLLYITHEGKNALLVTNLADAEGKGTVCRKVRRTLQQIYGELNRKEFFFIDRGCIVNLAQIMSIGADNCVLKDGTRLTVSQARMQGLKAQLLEFWKVRI